MGAESREEEAGAPLVPLRTEEAALCCPGYSAGSGVGGRGTETVDCVTFFFFWSFTFKRQDINACPFDRSWIPGWTPRSSVPFLTADF